MKRIGLKLPQLTLGRFAKDTSGQFAMMFALLAFPMLIAIAYVSDMTYAGKVKESLKGSLDSAALAAVINQTFDEKERADFAEAHFVENFEHSDLFDLTVINSSAKLVELEANGAFPSYIGAMTGQSEFSLSASSSSVLTSEKVICLMTLDPDGEASLKVTGNAKLLADKCAVQVNSTNVRAATVASGSSVTAASVCVSGGATGRYSPYVNTECSRVEDPYKNFNFVDQRPCDFTQRIKNNTAMLATNADTSSSGVAIAGDKAVLSPGVYCEDIRIDGKQVTFLPGTYVFRDSRLWFRDGSEVRADAVTIVMQGRKSELRMDDQSVLYLKAPITGPLAGLAIFQDKSSLGNKMDKMSGKTRFKGNSTISIVGTVYMPNHRIVIANGASSKLQNKALPLSPATSFIGYQVHIEDANLRVAVDHKTAGLPPLLPRADEGARLIK